MPPPPVRPTPPMAPQEGMSVSMGAPDGYGQEPGGQEGADLAGCLSELQAGGVSISPGPNGTLILSGVPDELLAAFAGDTVAPDA